MPRKLARILTLTLPALALAACSSQREEELARQLAEAKQSALEEAAHAKAAEREASAARAQTHEQDLAAFYSGETSEGGLPPEDLPAPPADDAPPPDPSQPQVAMPAEGAAPAGV